MVNGSCGNLLLQDTTKKVIKQYQNLKEAGADGMIVWQETYDKDISDIFSIETEVAQNIAKELKAT